MQFKCDDELSVEYRISCMLISHVCAPTNLPSIAAYGKAHYWICHATNSFKSSRLFCDVRFCLLSRQNYSINSKMLLITAESVVRHVRLQSIGKSKFFSVQLNKSVSRHFNAFYLSYAYDGKLVKFVNLK